MFYRYEARRPGQSSWLGICQWLPPPLLRKLARSISEPKWYENHPGADSRCWFTQYGYDRYRGMMESLIEECSGSYFQLEVRLLKEESLPNILMAGKVQCIAGK